MRTYGHVNVAVNVWDDKDEDRSEDGSWRHNKPQWLIYGEDVSPFWRLAMSCQTDTEKMAEDYHTGHPITQIDRFYGIKLEWTPSDGCTLRHMEEGVKPMRKLDRKLDALNTEAGYAATMGQYIYRLAMATGIHYIFIVGTDPIRYHSASYGQQLIDAEIEKWIIREKSEVVA